MKDLGIQSVRNFFVGICTVVARAVSSLCSRVSNIASRVLGQVSTAPSSRKLQESVTSGPVASTGELDLTVEQALARFAVENGYSDL